MIDIYFTYLLVDGSSYHEFYKIVNGIGYRHDFKTGKNVRDDTVIDCWKYRQDRCTRLSQWDWEERIACL